MSWTYAIADLHGRFDLLEKALRVIATHSAGHEFKIIPMGDYVDRGPQSRQIIEHLMALESTGVPIVCLKGNHEDMMVETLRKPLDRDWWVGSAGETTLRSYGVVVRAIISIG
jgi:serine/threonine protein phosphatase 1